MNSVAAHNHGRVLGVGQECHGPRIGDGVNPTQLDVDLEANVRKVLWFRLLALEALQALSCYSGLKGVISQG